MSLRFLVLAFCLPMSWAATAPEPAGVDERFKMVDALMVQVRTMMAQFELMVKSAEPALKTVKMPDHKELESQAQQRLLRKCSAVFSIDTIAKHKTPPLIYGSKSPIDGMVDAIRGYYECEAFMRREPGICKTLSRYQPWGVEEVHLIDGQTFYGNKVKTKNKPDDFEARCRMSYNRLSIIQWNVSGRPDAGRLCEALPLSKEELAGFTRQEECAWMTRKEPEPECENPLTPTSGRSAEECIYPRILHADASICPVIKDARLSGVIRSDYQAWCLDAAAYHKAYQAKSANQCGNSLECRVLMGENICGQHLEKFKKEYCRSWMKENLQDAAAILFAEQEASRKRGSEVIDMLKQRRAQVEELFKQINGRLEGFEPKSEPGYVSRRKAYWDLRRKFERPPKRKTSASKSPAKAAGLTPGE